MCAAHPRARACRILVCLPLKYCYVPNTLTTFSWEKELERRPVAMMCAEEDPLECHRFLMVGPELTKMGVFPAHIRKGSRIETQKAAENRLLADTGFEAVAADTLFPGARTDALEDAYKLQAEKFAFRAKPFVLDTW
jgi:hypothetical protein